MTFRDFALYRFDEARAHLGAAPTDAKVDAAWFSTVEVVVSDPRLTDAPQPPVARHFELERHFFEASADA